MTGLSADAELGPIRPEPRPTCRLDYRPRPAFPILNSPCPNAGSVPRVHSPEVPGQVRVFTPGEVAENNQSKYLGVLVASKYARELNLLPREAVVVADQKKLSTRALEAITSGQVEYRLVERRKPDSV